MKETTTLRRKLQEISDRINSYSDRINNYKDNPPIQTEEATKMALIVLFLRALGYEVTDPEDIIPESAADMDIKQQKKVDYALYIDNKPVMIVECKSWVNKKWDSRDFWQQLYNYFHSMSSDPYLNRFGILTNGVKYKFYSDLVERHRMDEEAFLEFDLNPLQFSEEFLQILNQFSQSNFDVQENLKIANELRTYSVMRAFVEELLKNPDKNKDFVLYCLRENKLNDKWERQENLFRKYSRMVKEVIDSCVNKVEIDFTQSSPEENDVKNRLYNFIKILLKKPQESFVIFCWKNSEVYKKGSWKKLVHSDFEPIIQKILKEYMNSRNTDTK